MGYYRKFFKDYGIIVAPLTNLLCKHSFTWTEESSRVFEKLQAVMFATLVLAIPDFSEPFVVEFDTSESGIGVVLLQNERPIAFYSQALAPQHRKLPTYEKELIGLAKTIRNWCTYFWESFFVVRTDHYSLKFLFEQRITTAPQQ